jgi:hypothetical protein
MSLAPFLHPPDVFGVSEVVAVGRLAKPAALAGQLAGVAAGAFAAVTLAVVITTIEEEKLPATRALTSFGPEAHRASKPTRRGRELKQNKRTEEGPERKKEEAFLGEPAEENPKEEKGISNRRFQGNFIPPLTTNGSSVFWPTCNWAGANYCPVRIFSAASCCPCSAN